jgi:hypothetical protein
VTSTNYGGGIWNAGTLTVAYSTLRDNTTAGAGGGIGNEFGELTLSHSTLSGNHALFSGGGVVTGAGHLRILQCTISGNEAMQHGGGVASASPLIVANSTISGNSSFDNGGGIYNYSIGIADVYNSTIVFNGANADGDFDATSGGGVFNANGSIFYLFNSVVAGNKAFAGSIDNDCSGTLSSFGENKFWTEAGCTVGQVAPGAHTLLGSLAELGPLRFNGGSTRTYALVAGSDMIDGAEATLGCHDDVGALAVDQRGGARAVGPVCDIGAFEFGALPVGLIFADGFELGNLWAWG